MELKRLLVNITLYNLPRKPKNSGDVSDDSKNSNKYLKRHKSGIGTHYQKEEENKNTEFIKCHKKIMW